MRGKGLVKGLGITLKHFFGKKLTQQYPEVRPNLPDKFRGSFELNVPKCISCGMCANACPNKVISVESVKDENNKKKLTGYKMMLERCLYCGFCVEACPTKALATTKEFERTVYSRNDVNLDLFNKYAPHKQDDKVSEDKKQAEEQNAQNTSK